MPQIIVAGITRPDGLYWRSNGCPASLTSAFLRRHCLLRCSHDRAATAVVDASGGLSSVPVAAYPSEEDDDVISAIFKLYLQLRVKYGHNGPTYVKF